MYKCINILIVMVTTNNVSLYLSIFDLPIVSSKNHLEICDVGIAMPIVELFVLITFNRQTFIKFLY